MFSLLPQVVLFTLIPVVATIAGGAIAAYRPPGKNMTSYVQHFAAGVVLAAVAGELLPDVVESGRFLFAVILGFALGLASMLGVKLLSARVVQGEGSTSLVATAGVDIFIDGLVIGIGFVAGGGAGTLLILALTVELLFLGLSVAASLGESGASPGRVIGTTSGLALLVMVGAAASVILLGGASEGVVTAVLAFGSVALLYLVTEELLVEAAEGEETAWDAAILFLGFLLVLVIEMVA